MPTHSLRTRCLLLLALLSATPALAQLRPQGAASASRWEVEIHGGGATNSASTNGSGELPAPGPAFNTFVGLPSERVSSWYFGDGALLLNFVDQTLGAAGRIQPLDGTLQRSGANWSGGPSLGARVGYQLTSKLTAEFNLDLPFGTLSPTSEFQDRLETSRASFVNAWNTSTGVLSTIPASNQVTTSTLDIDEGSARQLFATGAIRWDIAQRGSLTPYVTVGGGVVSNMGTAPSATLNGNYRFTVTISGTSLTISETDHVRLQLIPKSSSSLVGVFGGGVRLRRSATSGFRFDARAYLSQSTSDVVFDATPSVTPGSPVAGTIATLTPVSLQFSNVPSGSPFSTLSGPAVAGFHTFTSSGSVVHVSVSAGYYFRF